MAECFGQVPDADVFTKADLQARRQVCAGRCGYPPCCPAHCVPLALPRSPMRDTVHCAVLVPTSS